MGWVVCSLEESRSTLLVARTDTFKGVWPLHFPLHHQGGASQGPWDRTNRKMRVRSLQSLQITPDLRGPKVISPDWAHWATRAVRPKLPLLCQGGG